MKELTIEEKSKRYDEALERAKKLYNDGNSPVATTVEEIFPELKESEGERIRKELIAHFKTNSVSESWSGLNVKKVIAWLEKQGDKDKLIKELGEYKVKYTQEVLEKHINSMSNKDDERLRKTTIAFLKDFAEKGYENAIECIDWLEKQGEEIIPLEQIILNVWELGNYWKELTKGFCNTEYGTQLDYIAKHWKEGEHYIKSLKKQGEQKPTDKVEPKFKNGQWIVWQNKCYKVNYNGCGYELIDQNGLSTSLEYVTVDENAHLWTIQDAKDGDVLAFYSEYRGNKMVQVGIIEKYVGKHGGCSNTFKIYVGVNWDNNLQIGEYMGCSDILPATKEQRDALMKAMADADYTFDFEKKELKKIEED